MSIYPATKTLEAIAKAMEADQGASFRVLQQQVLPHIGDAYRGAETIPFRTHLGASGIGKECARSIFYGFRWVRPPKFDGRMLRLFNRGHLEEGRFIALLLMIGCQVWQQDENGKQFRISDAGGHYGGSGDGIIQGIPDLAPGQLCVGEFKTASDKSFNETKAKGVRETKFEHYVQMNQYMGKMGFGAAIYFVVNKNTDEIYAEIVPFDQAIYQMYLERGVNLVFATTPPPKINESPGWFKCRFCDEKDICHKGVAPYKTCRSCASVEVCTDGTWRCTLQEHKVLSSEEQFKACNNYTRAF